MRDFTGFTKGTYTYLKEDKRSKSGNRCIVIKCSCGHERTIEACDFTKKDRFYRCPKCLEFPIGGKSGMLTLLEIIPKTYPKKCIVKCDCGVIKKLNYYDVTIKKTISCGCASSDYYRKGNVRNLIRKTIKMGYTPKQTASILKLDEKKIIELLEREKAKKNETI